MVYLLQIPVILKINHKHYWMVKTASSSHCKQAHTQTNKHIMSCMSKHTHTLVFTASDDGQVRAWDIRSGSCKKVFKGHDYQVNCILVCVCSKLFQLNLYYECIIAHLMFVSILILSAALQEQRGVVLRII